MPNDSDAASALQHHEGAHPFHHLAPAADPQVLAALQDFHAHARDAFAHKTTQAWRHDTQVFVQWCIEHEHRALPAAPKTIAAFLDDMTRPVDAGGGGRATGTVLRYVATLAWMHRAAGVVNPCEDTHVQLAVRAIKRLQGVAKRQRDPLVWNHIATALTHSGVRLRDVFDAALVTVAYDALARSEDLRRLRIDDVAFDERGTGTIVVARGKTDPFGEGWVGFLSRTTVDRLKDWIQRAGIREGYLFRAVYRSGRVAPPEEGLSEAAVTRAFKRVAVNAGVDPSNIAGHSCRIGACQDLTAAGFALPHVMQAGRWRSAQMPAHYARQLAAERSAMAELAGLQLR